MADLIAVEDVDDFLVLGDGFLRALSEPLRAKFIAIEKPLMAGGVEDAQEFGLPLLALVKEVHVLTA